MLTNTFSTATWSGRCSAITRLKLSRMALRRSGNAPSGVRMTPLATYATRWPARSTTPKPVRRSPGSMPRMRTRGRAPASALKARAESILAVMRADRSLFEHGGRVHLLDVVQDLERVEQLLHPARVFAAQADFRDRLHRDLGQLGLEPRTLQRALDSDEVARRGDHLDAAVVVRDDILRAGFDRRFHDGVFARAGREHELPAVLEQECDRPVGAQVAAVLGEGVTHVGHRARLVVGHAVDHDRGAGDAVAFVAHFLVVHALELAAAAPNRALDVFLRHVGLVRLVHREPQARVGIGVRAAKARGDCDFLDETGEDLAPLRVLRGFLVLDVGPFAVTGHALDLLARRRFGSQTRRGYNRCSL